MISANWDYHLPPGQAPIRTSTTELFRAQVDLLLSSEHAPSAIGIAEGRPGTGKLIAARLYLAEEEQKWQAPDLTCAMLTMRPYATTLWLLDSVTRQISDMPRSRNPYDAFQHVLTTLEQRRVRLLMIDDTNYLAS